MKYDAMYNPTANSDKQSIDIVVSYLQTLVLE